LYEARSVDRGTGANVMKLISILGAGALVATALLATSANAAINLITNGSFETGDFTGWTTGATSFPQYIVTSPVEDGLYAAQIAGYSYGADTLSQVVATAAGQTYELSFWRYQVLAGPTISLDVTWDGTTVFSELNPIVQAYQNFTASVVGTGSDTLVFTAVNDPAYTYLDNVSLTAAVPEPATWAMMLLGFVGLGVAGYRGSRNSGALAA
jgi:hypothetical protein